MKARPWAFTLEITIKYLRSTTKNTVHLCCHVYCQAAAASHQTPDTQKKHVPPVFIATKKSLRSDRSRHNFLHLSPYHRNLYLDMPPRPHEATLAGEKGAHDLDGFQSRYPVTSCPKLRKSLNGRPELVRVKIEEADIKKISDMVLEDQQGQNHLYSDCRHRTHWPPPT